MRLVYSHMLASRARHWNAMVEQIGPVHELATEPAGFWRAAGPTDIRFLRRSAHMIGMCRLGPDPGSSVVDLFGHSHDAPAIPALTIMALSLPGATASLRGLPVVADLATVAT